MRRFPGSDIPASEPQSWLRRTLDRLVDYAAGKYPLSLVAGSQRARLLLNSTPEHPDAVLQVQVAVYVNGVQGWRTLLAVDGAGNATFRGAVACQTHGWRPETPYVLADLVTPQVHNGHRYQATVAGTSGTAEPSWPTGTGATVVDGGVTWTEDGAPTEADMNALGLEVQG